MNYFNTASKKYDVEYKVIIIGESRVGKTSIVKRLSNQEFTPNTISTVGIDFVNVFYLVEDVSVKLQIWDTAGQERFRTITRSHFRNTKGIILVFDVTSKDSFEKLEYWMESLSNMRLDSEIIYLLGNKCDLHNEREVSYAQAKKFADCNLLKYFETSAKSADNLYDIFKSLSLDILDLNDHKRIAVKKPEEINGENFMYVYNMPNEIYVVEKAATLKQQKKNRLNNLRRKLKQKNKTLANKARDLDQDLGSQFDSRFKLNFKSSKEKSFKLMNCCKIS